MPKISLEGFALLQSLWHSNPETAAVRKPIHPVGNSLIAEHRKNFLRKRHVFYFGGLNVTILWWDLAKVAVSVVHESLWFLDHLDNTGFHEIFVLNALEARLANLTRMLRLGFVLGRLRGGVCKLRLMRGIHCRDNLDVRVFRWFVWGEVHGSFEQRNRTNLQLGVYSSSCVDL